MAFDWKHALVFIVGALISFGLVKATDVCTTTTGTSTTTTVSAPAADAVHE